MWDMTYQDILRASGAIQAAALAEYNAKLALKKKKSTKDLVSMGATNIVGSSLIQAQSGFWD